MDAFKLLPLVNLSLELRTCQDKNLKERQHFCMRSAPGAQHTSSASTLVSSPRGLPKAERLRASVVELKPSATVGCGWHRFQATSQAPFLQGGNLTGTEMKTVLAENTGGGFCRGDGSHGNRLPNGELGDFLHNLLHFTQGLNRNTRGENPHSERTCAALARGEGEGAGSRHHLISRSVARQHSVTTHTSQPLPGSWTHESETSESGEGAYELQH